MYMSLLLAALSAGPDALLDKISSFVGARDISVAWRYTAYTLSWYCSSVLEYLPLLPRLPELFMDWVNNYTAGAYAPTS